MIVDICFAAFIILAMIAGYLSGGFREILKLTVFVAVFVIFNIPSVQSVMLAFTGSLNYSAIFIIAFLIFYIIIYQMLFFAFKGLIVEKEGITGELNKTLGLIFGFFRGIMILIVMVFIFEALLKRGIFMELKTSAYDSLFYSIVKTILDKTGLFFF